MKNDWVIIGGGIHGVHLAVRLIGEAGVPRERIRIIDENEHLLDRWRTCTATTGMTHLRSPAVHHLDLNPWSLVRFAGKQKGNKRKFFAPPYDRPSLELFNNHCDQLIQQFGLNDLHIRARALTCNVDCDEVRIELSDGNEITSHHVALALGNSERTEWPDWAPEADPRIHHIFDPEFDPLPSTPEQIVVIGGGISACQMALRLINGGHEVHLVSRHALREHQFDSDPGWLGPKNMTGFYKVRDTDKRRSIITQARHRGSVPPDVLHALRGAIKNKSLHWHEARVDELDTTEPLLRVSLSTGETLTSDRMLLATGFTTRRPGGSLIDNMVASHSLPCSSCGYPIVNSELRWHPRVFVAGPLAELELGPSSRNISGARRAGERLVKAIQSGQYQSEAAA